MVHRAAKPSLTSKQQDVLNKILVTSIATFILVTFLAPLGYMFTTGLKSDEQMSDPQAPPFWPYSKATFTYEGEDLDVLQVPFDDGTQELAILTKRRTESWFIDPDNPEAGEIHWEGNWRLLEPVYASDPQWQNFKTAWDELKFPRLFLNTLIIAGLGTFGAVGSSVLKGK